MRIILCRRRSYQFHCKPISPNTNLISFVFEPRADIMLATLRHPISLENSIGITVKNCKITLRIVSAVEQDFSLYLSGFHCHKALRVLRKTINVVNFVKIGGVLNTRRNRNLECWIWAKIFGVSFSMKYPKTERIKRKFQSDKWRQI